METKIQAQRICLKKEKLCTGIEQIVESDISLADYYGDIVKILGSCSAVNIFSAAVTGGKAVIDGSVTVRAIYIDNKGKTEIFETECPFNRSVDVRDGSESDGVSVTVTHEQITCRAVNQRRAEIRGSVSLKISVTAAEECDIANSQTVDFCHVLECNASGSFLCASASRISTHTAQETAASGALKLYRVDCVPFVSETRSIKNKIMIKGSISLDAVMLTADGAFVSQRITVPVNQIADVEGVDEESRCCVSLNVQSCEARLVSDSSEQMQLEVSLTVCAQIDAYIHKSINGVCDAYSSEYELVCREQKIKCINDIYYLNENYTVTSKMDFSSCKASEIIDAAVKKIRFGVTNEDGTAVIKGNIHFGLIIASEDGEMHYFERIDDFEYRKQFSTDADIASFKPDIYASCVNAKTDSSAGTVINTELHLSGFAAGCTEKSIITQIEKGAAKENKRDEGIISVCFASKGERLWDIAKSYGSCVETIKQQNDTDEDVLTADRMLVFELE